MGHKQGRTVWSVILWARALLQHPPPSSSLGSHGRAPTASPDAPAVLLLTAALRTSLTALPVQCYTYSHGLFYPLDCALPEDASALLIPTSPVSAQSGLNKPWPAAWMVLSIGQLGLLLQITLT